MYTVNIDNMTDNTMIEYFGTLDEMAAHYHEEYKSFEREGWTQVYSEEVNECVDTMSEWRYTDGETIILTLAEVE